MRRPENPSEFVAWNEAMVERYDPDVYHTASPLPVRVIEQLRVRAVVRLLGARPDSRVLEVGSGAGNVLARLPGRRFGIDLSKAVLAKARRRLGPGASLVRGDAMSLPFADGSFDRVFCSEVLEHVLQPEAVVKEMRRVLRPSGTAVISVPNEDLINQVKGIVWRLPLGRRLTSGADGNGYRVSEKMDDEWHLHAFDRARLREAVAGRFAVEELVGIPSRLLPLRWVARLSPL
jgi:SAM-dependent methyltransferase